MTVVFASDHAGYRMCHELEEFTQTLGYDTFRVGATSEDAFDYPDAADAGCAAILNGQASFGVFVCGSGVGICIRANRHKGIRAVSAQTAEVARMARQHNHANVLCLGQRVIEPAVALEALEAFLEEGEDTAERHIRRVDKLDWNA